MQAQIAKTAEQYASAAENLSGADFEISLRHFENSLQILKHGEPHNRHRGVKHPIMIGVYLSEDFIYMLDKFTDWLKSTGQLNSYAKRQDFIRNSIVEQMMKVLEERMAPHS